MVFAHRKVFKPFSNWHRITHLSPTRRLLHQTATVSHSLGYTSDLITTTDFPRDKARRDWSLSRSALMCRESPWKTQGKSRGVPPRLSGASVGPGGKYYVLSYDGHHWGLTGAMWCYIPGSHRHNSGEASRREPSPQISTCSVTCSYLLKSVDFMKVQWVSTFECIACNKLMGNKPRSGLEGSISIFGTECFKRSKNQVIAIQTYIMSSRSLLPFFGSQSSAQFWKSDWILRCQRLR